VKKGMVAWAVAVIIISMAAVQSFAPPRIDRALQKAAGLYLLGYDPGSVVAARLPLVAFYENGVSVDLLAEMAGRKDMAWFIKVLNERHVKYLIVDEETERELPFLRAYLTQKVPVWDSSLDAMSVRIYRVP